MNQVYSYVVTEQYENTLTVYVNNIIIAYVTGKRLNSIRSVRKFVDKVLNARDRRPEITPILTYNQVKYLNQLHNKEKNHV